MMRGTIEKDFNIKKILTFKKDIFLSTTKKWFR